MTYSNYHYDPFSEKGNPSAPTAVFTNDQKSPKRLIQSNQITDSDEESDFVAFPSSVPKIPDQRRSPNIFSRSSNQAKRSNVNISRSSIPLLAIQPETTPRADFTMQESPKRTRNKISSQRDYDSNTFFTRSSKEFRSSERILEPPQPIFDPEQREHTNCQSEKFYDEQTLDSREGGYRFSAYQKEYNDIESFSDTNTAITESSVSQGASDYFQASLDQDMMQKMTKSYVPNTEKKVMKRRVRLVDGKSGNLVLENRIPDELKKVLTRTDSPFGEFTNMTYTACTAEPDDFLKEGFTLRAAKYGRETELVVCVTMYNEDEISFARTMHGIMKNVAHLCSRNKSSTWGRDAWKKVQVIIVADGRNKISDSVLQLLTATGCYQENLTRPYVNNKKVNAHLFEYTTQISIDENLKFKGDEKSLTPVQVLFCLKESNQKKLILTGGFLTHFVRR